MKKFLSLVLAVIMTMSLVTISASAAEYKDFTDKDEIQYEEAVAVLNRLGIITGYSEGDFRPEGELTRGAAAKIIVSLLIGPDAANNVSPTTAPYKDVPLDHAFAGVIAYCKTAGIISGYKDGSFQPGGTLTGYAFSKMLLGALGFNSDIEHFTGSGWNMNVNARAAEAGLFDRLSFKGNDPVNREEAAQLALNTLKATMVEYTGGINVSTSDGSTMSSPANRIYKTSNQEYAQHISNKKAGGQQAADNTWFTVEFGEEHFVDLRMKTEQSQFDDFGRPSNEWSYKKVTIGTYPIEADKVYTEQVAHDVTTVTNASKARALELNGFVVDNKTTVTVNGRDAGKISDVGEIANFTDNGTVVEVYIDEDRADWIKNVVVIKTQLMEIKRVGSDYVALGLYDNGSDGKTSGKSKYLGFNQAPIDTSVANVEVDDNYYSLLSGLKAGDLVAVVPVTTDEGSSYSVAKAYVPETVSGALTNVESYANLSSDPHAVGVTVGDTAYDIALWSKDLVGIDGKKLDVTTKDVTLILDEFGNAMLAKDVGETSDFMVVGGYYQNLVNGKLVTYVKGWDISGEELNLNLGSKYEKQATIRPGDLAYYSNLDAAGDADWTLSDDAGRGVVDVKTDHDAAVNALYSIKGSNTHIAIKDDTVFGTTTNPGTNPWTDKGIKFIYVTFGDDNDVDFIEIKKGVQSTNNDELKQKGPDTGSNPAQAALKLKDGYVNADSTVKAVVIKNESNDAVANNMLYIITYKATANKVDGDVVYSYTVAMNTANGIEEKEIFSTKQMSRGQWARYTKMENTNFDEFYRLKEVNQIKRATSTADFELDTMLKANHSIIRVKNATEPGRGSKIVIPEIISNKKNNLGLGDDDASRYLSVINAKWISVDTREIIEDYDDLWDLVYGDDAKYKAENVRFSMIFNDDVTKTDGFRSVAVVVVKTLGEEVKGGSSGGGSGSNRGDGYTSSYNIPGPGILSWNLSIERPTWAAPEAKVSYTYSVKVSGFQVDYGSVTTSSDLTKTGRVYQNVAENEDVAVEVTGISWSGVALVNDDPAVGAVITSPNAADIKAGLTAGVSATIKFTIPANKYTAGKVTVVQNGKNLTTPTALTDDALKNGAETTVNVETNKIENGYPVQLVFSDMTAIERNLQTDAPTVGAADVHYSDRDEKALKNAVAILTGTDDEKAAAKNNLVNTFVKEHTAPGVYNLPILTDAEGHEIANGGGALYCANRWDDVIILRYNGMGVTNGETYKLVVTGKDASTKADVDYTYTTSSMSDRDPHFITLQVRSSNGDFGNTEENASGTLIHNAPARGTVLSYQIIGSVSGVILEGTYTT